MKHCSYCGPKLIELQQDMLSDVLMCPCCSSRFDGAGQLLHFGSHNDFAIYICGALEAA